MAEKEYIEREAFIEILKKTEKDCEHYADKVCCDFAIRMVNLMPPADVQEVRHGKWIKEYLSYGVIRYRCSVCNGMFSQNMIDFNHKNFCTDCGAKMDKER